MAILNNKLEIKITFSEEEQKLMNRFSGRHNVKNREDLLQKIWEYCDLSNDPCERCRVHRDEGHCGIYCGECSRYKALKLLRLAIEYESKRECSRCGGYTIYKDKDICHDCYLCESQIRKHPRPWAFQ